MSQIVIDAFKEVAAQVNDSHSGDVYFMYGHRKEVNQRLLEKSEDKVYKYQKYPLIVLNMPFSEDISSDRVIELSLNLAVMDYTDTTYISEERYEKVFAPILEPIYELLLDKIENSGEFMNIGKPEHTRIDRLFWGTEGGQQTFSDPLDAIELLNLKLKLLNTKC